MPGSVRPSTPNATVRRLASLLAAAAVIAACSSATPSGSPAGSAAAGSSTAPGSAAPATSPAPATAAAGLPALADVPVYRMDAARTAIQPGPGPDAAPSLAWQHPLGSAHFLPILTGGLVITGTADGLVTAIDARTGAEAWHFQAAGSVGQSAAAADGTVYFGDTHSVIAVDAATGAKRWATDVPSNETRPLVVDGVVYSSSIGGVVGLDAATGAETWRWTGPSGVSAGVGPVVDGVAYISAGDGRLYAIDIATSTEKWHVQTISTSVGYAEVIGDTVYVGTVQADVPQLVGELYAIDRASGDVRWRFRTPSGGQISAGPVRDGVLYSNTEHDGLYALRDAGTSAQIVWHVDAPRAYWPSAMVNDSVYVQGADGSISTYALADGHQLWSTPATGDEAGGPLVSGGMAFELQDNNGLTAFATPELIAQLPASAPHATATPAPAAGSGPFKQVHAIPWADTGIGTVLGMDPGPDGLLYVLDTKPQVTVIDPDTGKVVRTWGRQGTGPGEFDVSRNDDNPGFGDISVGPNGNVYVNDGTNHRVQVFKADGTFIRQFGSFGTGPGQFADGQEIEVGPDGSVYVMDDLDNPLSKYTADGKFVWRSTIKPGTPGVNGFVHGVAVRKDGSLILTCEACPRFLIVDPATGSLVTTLPSSKADGGYINLDPDGNIFVSMFYPLSELVFDPKGTFLDGLYHAPGGVTTVPGAVTTWGDVFWAAPVFLPDGRAFSFGKDGLIELSVTLP